MFRQTILAIVLSVFVQLNAQEPYFRHFGVEEGLPGSEVYDIMQDRSGYIWIATDRGVSRYDGYAFHNFSSADGLTDNTIFILTEDHTGKIWCATFNNRLCYFIGDSIFPYKYNFVLEKEAHSNRVIQSLSITESGELIIGYQRNGCLRVDTNGNVSRFAPPFPGNGIHHEVHAEHDYFSYGSSSKDDSSGQAGQRILHAWLNGQRTDLIIGERNPSHYITCIRRNNGSVLAGVGTFLVEISVNKSEIIRSFPATIIRMNEDAEGNTWISLAGMGVRKFSPGADLKSDSFSAFLSEETVTDIFQDHEGGYWFATLGHGIFYLASAHVHCMKPVNEKPETPITALASHAYGEVAMGTANGILHFCANGKINSTLPAGARPDSLAFIQDVCFNEKKHETWVSTNKKIFYYSSDGQYHLAINSGFSRTICTDSSGGCWIGGTGRLVYFSPDEPRRETRVLMLDCRIEALFYDRITGHLFVGRNDGLFFLDGDSLRLYDTPGGPVNSRVSSITRTADGALAVGTIGEGVRIIQSNGQIIVGVQQGLCSPMVNDLSVGADGNLWVATNGGVSCLRFVADTFQVSCYSVFHGLPTNEIRRIHAQRDTIWIGTNIGAAWFIPAQIDHQPVFPPVYISQLLINGEKQNVLLTGDFDYGENQVRVDFLGIAFRNWGKTNYRYRLAGLEETWNYTDNTSVEYASLAPGTYRFEVLAQNGDGTWSEDPATYDFVIHPPFWQRWWFWTFAALFCIAVTWKLIHNRLKTLRLNALRREQLADYQHRALAAQMNPHFVFNSLSSMQAFVLNDEKENALRYIDRFSFLMRKGLEHSMLRFVPLEKENEVLRAYLDIESMRFGEKLSYEISCSPLLSQEEFEIPAMLVQPFVENAIRHGLLHRQNTGGYVHINFFLQDDALWCTVEDNGVGRKNSAQINLSRKRPTSYGSSITEERLRLLCNVTGQPFLISYTDKTNDDGSAAGTIVSFLLPSRKRKRKDESPAHR